jgi:hypothetical protein
MKFVFPIILYYKNTQSSVESVHMHFVIAEARNYIKITLVDFHNHNFSNLDRISKKWV